MPLKKIYIQTQGTLQEQRAKAIFKDSDGNLVGSQPPNQWERKVLQIPVNEGKQQQITIFLVLSIIGFFCFVFVSSFYLYANFTPV